MSTTRDIKQQRIIDEIHRLRIKYNITYDDLKSEETSLPPELYTKLLSKINQLKKGVIVEVPLDKFCFSVLLYGNRIDHHIIQGAISFVAYDYTCELDLPEAVRDEMVEPFFNEHGKLFDYVLNKALESEQGQAFHELAVETAELIKGYKIDGYVIDYDKLVKDANLLR